MKFRPKVVRRIRILMGYAGLAIIHVHLGLAAPLCYVLVPTGCAMEVWTDSGHTETK